MLSALDPFSYEYAGLSTAFSKNTDPSWYKYLGRCWQAANISDWMPEGFPQDVRRDCVCVCVCVSRVRVPCLRVHVCRAYVCMCVVRMCACVRVYVHECTCVYV